MNALPDQLEPCKLRTFGVKLSKADVRRFAMNLWHLLTLASTFALAVHGESISHDSVKAIQQTEAITISEKAAVRFKPQLNIGNGCHSYPAVNAEGQTSGGLKPSGSPTSGCKGFFVTSQVYVRAGWYNDVWGIMYAWYFPKDSPESDQGHRHDWENIVVWIENPSPEYPKLLGVSTSSDDGEYLKYAPLNADLIAGNAPLVKYESKDGKSHSLSLNEYSGDLQELITWTQLPELARIALNETSFEPATVPFKDATFQTNLQKAWPF